jgi:hypothetical protein
MGEAFIPRESSVKHMALVVPQLIVLPLLLMKLGLLRSYLKSFDENSDSFYYLTTDGTAPSGNPTLLKACCGIFFSKGWCFISEQNFILV